HLDLQKGGRHSEKAQTLPINTRSRNPEGSDPCIVVWRRRARGSALGKISRHGMEHQVRRHHQFPGENEGRWLRLHEEVDGRLYHYESLPGVPGSAPEKGVSPLQDRRKE